LVGCFLPFPFSLSSVVGLWALKISLGFPFGAFLFAVSVTVGVFPVAVVQFPMRSVSHFAFQRGVFMKEQLAYLSNRTKQE
jgi:hypothetical protein